MSASPRSVSGVLKAAADFLDSRSVEQPRLAAELLMARLLGCKRLELYLRFDEDLSEKRLESMRRGIKRVAACEPVQYVLGQVDFMGHSLKVDRRALIPRPETEILVEQVLACEPLWAEEHPSVIDLGTGSGCIAIGLALARPHGLFIGLDVSEDALALARENAEALGVSERIAFSRDDMADLVEPASVDAVVANLPYVSTSEYKQLAPNVRDFEPEIALNGGPDGLSIVREAVQDAAIALKPGARLFLEIGMEQGRKTTELMHGVGFDGVSIVRDLSGRDRIVHGVLAG